MPISVAALGPKGAGVARELGDGLYITLALPEFATEFSWVSYLFWGTIRDDGEDLDSDRVRAAGGPGWALAYHGAYEFETPLEDLPGGPEWKAVVERTAPEERHLPSTTSTASASTRPTRRPGTRVAIRCWTR